MKRLLLALLASLALPTVVNAETMTMKETEYSDTLSFGSFVGSLMAICHAEEKGFISNNERLEMIKIFTSFHKDLYEDKTTYKEDKEQGFSNIRDMFPNCLP